MILVDTNILIDILAKDPIWEAPSTVVLELATVRDVVVVADVVYAELAPRYPGTDELDAALERLKLKTATTPKQALFLAGHAHRLYRRRGGTKTGVLADFFIGAHAAVEGASLLTRDPGRVRAYFPTVTLIAP